MRKRRPKGRALFPLEDWQYEVANGDTCLGYEDWLQHQVEADEHDRLDECPTARGSRPSNRRHRTKIGEDRGNES